MRKPFNHYHISYFLEIEPEDGGVDYGGTGENGHDGFILPESEIRRVREQLAESFTTVYYRQAGPPHIQSVRIFDEATGAGTSVHTASRTFWGGAVNRAVH